MISLFARTIPLLALLLVGCFRIGECDPPEPVNETVAELTAGVTSRFALRLEPREEPLSYDVDLRLYVEQDFDTDEGLPITLTLARDGAELASNTAVYPAVTYGDVEDCLSPCSFDVDVTVDAADPRASLFLTARSSEPDALSACPLELQGSYVLEPR
jgi:hypothetical protein